MNDPLNPFLLISDIDHGLALPGAIALSKSFREAA